MIFLRDTWCDMIEKEIQQHFLCFLENENSLSSL